MGNAGCSVGIIYYPGYGVGMTEFNLLHPKWHDIGRLDIKSADGNRLYSIDFRQYHRLTQLRVDELDGLLHEYHEALAAATSALYQVAAWANKPVDAGGSYDDLVVDILPQIKTALDKVDIDVTAVNPP